MYFCMFGSFTGLCLERPGCECVPKKTRQVKVDIVVGVNSSSTTSGQLCSSIEIEEHRGPCKVSTSVQAEKIKIAVTTFLDPWDLTTHMAGHFYL